MDGVAPGSAAHVRDARVTALAALGDGVRRVGRAPAILAGVWVVSALFSLPLALVMWGAYCLLFFVVQPWLFGSAVYGRLTRELTVERTAFLIALGLYIVFGIVLAACNLVFDYAKVRAVVEDRRSMLGAVVAAIGFIRRNAAAASLLYAVDFALFAAALGIYALIAPGAGGGGASVWFGLAIGQLYVLARLWVKLVFWASETALFQGRLAHGGYVAAPARLWPDSPTAAAIQRP